jgi:hypothetical protein
MSDTTESAPVSDKKPRAKKTQYKALVGLNYGDSRVEAGAVVNDIPEDSIGWLLECNAIEKVN